MGKELKTLDHILFHYGIDKTNIQEAYVIQKIDEFVHLKIIKSDGGFYFKWFKLTGVFEIDKWLEE